MKKSRLIITAAVLIFIDQLTKYIAVLYLKNTEGIAVIPSVFRFTYIENEGVAFGMFANHRWLFMTLTAIIIIGCIYMLIKGTDSKLADICVMLFFAGGIGNMIDRVFRGYVVDFLDPAFLTGMGINSYVFNIADSCVTIGAGVLLIYIIQDSKKQKNENS